MQLFAAILRIFQCLFAIVVLGLSVTLAKGQVVNSVPATTGYGAFTGGLGILAALIGFGSLFVDSLNGIITWALDGLASLAFLAGGLAFAITLRGTDCSNPNTTWNNVLLSGGCITVNGQLGCAYGDGKLNSRCSSAKADAAFMFIDFIVCITIIACSFFLSGKNRSFRGGVV
ncbi:hypothetical protein VTN77DRAFT_7183 [Rasamsonia byssochlamydoides]|uniref:uncharacterized protein n=1 Tax=Rasamsonia byssochlamydoides TaxID=89139 RepID=UPI00374400E9